MGKERSSTWRETMTKREVIKATLDGEIPPYVPWSFSFTREAREKLVQHFGTQDLESALHNHILGLGNDIGFDSSALDSLSTSEHGRFAEWKT